MVVTKYFPATTSSCSRSSVSGPSARTRTRRPGRSSRRCGRRCPGARASSCTSSGACSPTRLATSPHMPTSSTPSTGSAARGLSAGAVTRPTAARVLLQVDLDPGDDQSRRDASSGRVPEDAAAAVAVPGGLSASGRHGDRPRGSRPRRELRPPLGRRDGIRAQHPERRLGVGRHEWRPRGGHPARSDTPACRNRNPRLTPVTSVTSRPRLPEVWEWAWQGHCARRWCTWDSAKRTHVTTRYDDYDVL